MATLWRHTSGVSRPCSNPAPCAFSAVSAREVSSKLSELLPSSAANVAHLCMKGVFPADIRIYHSTLLMLSHQYVYVGNFSTVLMNMCMVNHVYCSKCAKLCWKGCKKDNLYDIVKGINPNAVSVAQQQPVKPKV
jgi:hypothetical protein